MDVKALEAKKHVKILGKLQKYRYDCSKPGEDDHCLVCICKETLNMRSNSGQSETDLIFGFSVV